jgi:acyl dehydratase
MVFIDPLLPYVYDGCTQIEFPIHTSPRFAVGVGLPGIILQGTATLACAIREIVNREARGNPECIREIFCKFTGMVIPGSHIEIRCLESREQTDQKDLFFDVLNAENKKAIRSGYVKLTKETP